MLLQGVEQGVDAGQHAERVLRHLGDEAGDVARVDDQQVAAAQAEKEEEVRGDGEDVVQRQGGDDPFAVGGEWRADPGLRLVHVGQQVAVRQHGALGEAGGAAGVLQEGDVLRPDVDRPEHGFPALHDGLPEADGLGQIPGRDQPLQVFDDEIDRQPPVAQEVAEAGNDDGFDRGFVDDLRERVREVFQDDDDPCAAVGELELQFARFVERVAVDHGVAAAQRAKDADRVLQDVGQHDGDAFAARQVEHVLQPGGEVLHQRIEFAIAEFCAHAEKGGALAVVLHAFGEHRVQGREFVRVDVGRNACFVVGQPDFFHDDVFSACWLEMHSYDYAVANRTYNSYHQQISVGKQQRTVNRTVGVDAGDGAAVVGDLLTIFVEPFAVAAATLVVEHPEGVVVFDQPVDAPQAAITVADVDFVPGLPVLGRIEKALQFWRGEQAACLRGGVAAGFGGKAGVQVGVIAAAFAVAFEQGVQQDAVTLGVARRDAAFTDGRQPTLPSPASGRGVGGEGRRVIFQRRVC